MAWAGGQLVASKALSQAVPLGASHLGNPIAAGDRFRQRLENSSKIDTEGAEGVKELRPRASGRAD